MNDKIRVNGTIGTSRVRMVNNKIRDKPFKFCAQRHEQKKHVDNGMSLLERCLYRGKQIVNDGGL